MESAEELGLPLGAQRCEGCRLDRGGVGEGLVSADDGEQDRVAHLVRVRVRVRVSVGVGVGVGVRVSGEGQG